MFDTHVKSLLSRKKFQLQVESR